MSGVALAVGLGGAAISGGLAYASSKKAASAANRAGEQSQEFAATEADKAMLRQLVAYLGPEQGLAKFKAFVGPERATQLFGKKAANPNFSADQQRRLDDINTQINQLSQVRGTQDIRNRQRYQDQINTLQKERDDLVKAAGGSPGVTGTFSEEEIKKLGPGLVDEYGSLADTFGKRGKAELNRYDADTLGLTRQSRDITRQAEQFGKGEAARIKRDSAESLDNANRLATATLMGRGMGAGSSLTSAYAGNARDIGRTREDALGSLGDRQIGLLSGLRTGTLGLASSRSTGRTGLSMGNTQQDLGLRTNALNMKGSVLNSALTPSWLGQMAPSFYPGASPSGAGMGSLASAFAGASSPMLGYGLMGLSQQQGQGARGVTPQQDTENWRLFTNQGYQG